MPPVIRLSALPNTIERYMSEETGDTVIRAIHSERKTRSDSNRNIPRVPDKGSEKGSARPSTVDHNQKCSICHMTGHTKQSCYPFAKYLVYRDAEQHVDTAARSKLLAAYKLALKQKQELRRKRQQLGTIRQMWQAGNSYEEFETSLLECIPDLVDHDDSSSSDDESVE